MARPRRSANPTSPEAGAEQVVERTLNQTKPGFDEHELRRRRMDVAYDVWRGNTGLNPARGNMNSWQSRMRVKLGMQVIDQAMVNLVQGVPKAKVTPRHPGTSELNAKAMEELLGYYADLDHLAEHEALICQQGLVYGVAPAKSCWYYREEQVTQYVPQIDPETRISTWSPKSGVIVTDDRPAFEPWDAYSVWWDPAARSVDDSTYIVLESWMTRDQLEMRRLDDDNPTGQYRNLDLLYASGDGPKPPSTAQNRMIQQPLGTYRGRYQIWEIWRKTAAGMRLTIIGNRKVLLRDGPGPYWMNQYPITISNTRPDMMRIEGVSESELIDHLQQAFWTVHNLRMEQLKMTVMRGMTVRQTVPDLASLIMRPNFQFVVTDHDDIQFQDPPPLPREAYQETDNILSLMQLVTGITPYVGGASGTTTGVDQNTATGVSLLSESANRLLSFKASIIHQRTWQRTFEHWAALTQQYLRQKQAIRIVGPDGPVWANFGPDEVIGEFDIRVEAGDEAAARSQERADATAMMNALFPYVQLGVVDPKPLVEKFGAAFNFPNPDSLIKEQQPIPPASPNPGQPMLTPGGPPPQLLGTGLAGRQPLGQHPLASIVNGNQGRPQLG